jgi:hypothetical protein
MPRGFQKIGHLMARYSDRFGDPRGVLTIEIPDTLTRVGTPFNVRTSSRTLYTFLDVRGGWASQTEDNIERRGRADGRLIEVVFFLWKHDCDEQQLRFLLGSPGAILTWEGKRCDVSQILKDEYQDALVLLLVRRGPLGEIDPDAPVPVLAAATLGGLARVEAVLLAAAGLPPAEERR